MYPTQWSQFKQFRTLKMDNNQKDQAAQNEEVMEDTSVEMPTTEAETESTSDAEVVDNAEAETEVGGEGDTKQAPESTDKLEKKPSRIERNLSKVLEKNKSLSNNLSNKEQELEKLYQFLTNKNQAPTRESDNDSLFTQEDLEQGAISDPKAFEERIANRINKEVESRLQRAESRNRMKQVVEQHTNELTEVEGMEEFADDDVFNTYLEFYENLNYVNGTFVGKLSPKQVAEKYLSGAKKFAERYASGITSKMVQQQMDGGAISPTSDVRPSASNNLDGLYQQALNSQRDDDWQAYFKAKMFS